jgi:hypothetical protein
MMYALRTPGSAEVERDQPQSNVHAAATAPHLTIRPRAWLGSRGWCSASLLARSVLERHRGATSGFAQSLHRRLRSGGA